MLNIIRVKTARNGGVLKGKNVFWVAYVIADEGNAIKKFEGAFEK